MWAGLFRYWRRKIKEEISLVKYISWKISSKLKIKLMHKHLMHHQMVNLSSGHSLISVRILLLKITLKLFNNIEMIATNNKNLAN
jgi:hypothetical protein